MTYLAVWCVFAIGILSGIAFTVCVGYMLAEDPGEPMPPHPEREPVFYDQDAEEEVA